MVVVGAGVVVVGAGVVVVVVVDVVVDVVAVVVVGARVVVVVPPHQIWFIPLTVRIVMVANCAGL